VTVVSGGGFTGLASSTVVDTADLTPADADDLRSRVRAALPDLRAGSPASPVADGMQYRITVEDGGATDRYTAADGSMAPTVRSLVTWVETQPAARRNP
jgi:hypothetical protein